MTKLTSEERERMRKERPDLYGSVKDLLEERHQLWKKIIIAAFDTKVIDVGAMFGRNRLKGAVRLVTSVDRDANETVRALFDDLNGLEKELREDRDKLYRPLPVESRRKRVRAKLPDGYSWYDDTEELA